MHTKQCELVKNEFDFFGAIVFMRWQDAQKEEEFRAKWLVFFYFSWSIRNTTAQYEHKHNHATIEIVSMDYLRHLKLHLNSSENSKFEKIIIDRIVSNALVVRDLVIGLKIYSDSNGGTLAGYRNWKTKQTHWFNIDRYTHIEFVTTKCCLVDAKL